MSAHADYIQEQAEADRLAERERRRSPMAQATKPSEPPVGTDTGNQQTGTATANGLIASVALTPGLYRVQLETELSLTSGSWAGTDGILLFSNGISSKGLANSGFASAGRLSLTGLVLAGGSFGTGWFPSVGVGTAATWQLDWSLTVVSA